MSIARRLIIPVAVPCLIVTGLGIWRMRSARVRIAPNSLFDASGRDRIVSIADKDRQQYAKWEMSADERRLLPSRSRGSWLRWMVGDGRRPKGNGVNLAKKPLQRVSL